MSIKVALCDDDQHNMDQVQELIRAHPKGALFEVSCFLTTEALLNQSTVYDLLITDIEKAPGDINGFELASRMNENTKIIMFSAHDPNIIYYRMSHYYFELFAYITKWHREEIMPVLEKYLAWREDAKPYYPLVPKRTPPPRPSSTFKVNPKAEVTLYHDDILYLHQAYFLISPIIIVALDGEYKMSGYFKKLAQLHQLSFQFMLINNDHYLVNLDRCTLNKGAGTLTLKVNDEPIKIFTLSYEECYIVKRYNFNKSCQFY